MTDPADLRVLCYAGHRGEQTPQQFFLGERAVDVAEVLDSWIAPDHRYFKCRGSDGDVYILRHDVGRDRWELTMFARGSWQDGAEPPRNRGRAVN
ncbi:MAG: hypothetical protein JXB36_07940 [Gammaproteobacteria bacterium]|nr:hypothetical protein [Gammaproteobacteria bacterium]